MIDISYDWTLANAKFPKDRGNVFSCFACAGGSTMGYKLAGFNVIGCNEIDPKVAQMYRVNHSPEFMYIDDIREMVTDKNLPSALFSLDILDGSPPCTSFSMAGVRERDWGVRRQYAEGGKIQVLDTLFFDFIALAKRLQPKIVIAENVAGILVGEAMKYTARILNSFDDAGYVSKYFSLNGADMGLPQSRQRVFFIAVRKDLADEIDIGSFRMEFSEPRIPYSAIASYGKPYKELTELGKKYWQDAVPGGAIGKFDSQRKARMDRPVPTILASNRGSYAPHEPRFSMLTKSFWHRLFHVITISSVRTRYTCAVCQCRRSCLPV